MKTPTVREFAVVVGSYETGLYTVTEFTDLRKALDFAESINTEENHVRLTMPSLSHRDLYDSWDSED